MSTLPTFVSMGCESTQFAEFAHEMDRVYVCMYEGWATKTSPCTATFKDPLYFGPGVRSIAYLIMASELRK
jgi:hypothetical protein